MKVVTGSASVHLSRRLAEILRVDLIVGEVRTFADGELYVRVPEQLDGKDVVLVQTIYPNDKLLELFLLQDALRDITASLTVVIPYFAYGRQDKRFKEGEAVSSRAVAERVEINAHRIITVDVHDKRAMEYFSLPAVDISGMPALARYLGDRGVEMIVAPDENAARRARIVGDLMKVPWEYFKKERIDSWTVETEEKTLEVRGLKVAVVDDVISTGGTMASAARILRDQGAKEVVAGCVHGLFVKGAKDRLRDFDEVICTDTVYGTNSKVSVAPEVADELRRLT
ncbi:MAG: ribose-phosphate diphosphokinase [Candidatus Thermoplasmatota archaeon]|nr:ribose-phosphate diphosphokinase [Candidatus Thermoplasmatota archaeon]